MDLKKELERSEIQEIASEYDTSDIKIGIFGSHSALPIGFAARKAGLETILFSKKGRGKTYFKHNNKLYNEIVLLDDWTEIILREHQEKMREENIIFIPNRSFVVYTGLENIENKFRIPLYGSRKLLRAEERNAESPRNQYYIMEESNVRKPKLFEKPEEIDRLSVVKVQQKDNPLERAYFYPSTLQEYNEISERKIKTGEISREGLENATIEEFIIGPMLNANFHSYGLNISGSEHAFDNKIDLIGFSDREQTNETGYRGLPAEIQIELSERGFQRTNEEICHKGKTLRESKLEMIYDVAEKIMHTLIEEIPPGMIGPIGIQGAVPTDENNNPEFIVFDLSFRVPGDPAMGPTSPYLKYLNIKHSEIFSDFMPENWMIEEPLDLAMMEIKLAAQTRNLREIVT